MPTIATKQQWRSKKSKRKKLIEMHVLKYTQKSLKYEWNVSTERPKEKRNHFVNIDIVQSISSDFRPRLLAQRPILSHHAVILFIVDFPSPLTDDQWSSSKKEQKGGKILFFPSAFWEEQVIPPTPPDNRLSWFHPLTRNRMTLLQRRLDADKRSCSSFDLAWILLVQWCTNWYFSKIFASANST